MCMNLCMTRPAQEQQIVQVVAALTPTFAMVALYGAALFSAPFT